MIVIILIIIVIITIVIIIIIIIIIIITIVIIIINMSTWPGTGWTELLLNLRGTSPPLQPFSFVRC